MVCMRARPWARLIKPRLMATGIDMMQIPTFPDVTVSPDAVSSRANPLTEVTKVPEIGKCLFCTRVNKASSLIWKFVA